MLDTSLNLYFFVTFEVSSRRCSYYAGDKNWTAPLTIKATAEARAAAQTVCEKSGITRKESLEYCIYDVLASGHYYFAKIENDADQD